MKRIAIVFVVGFLVFSSVLCATAKEVASGICGEKVTWSYGDGVLIISGEGEMKDFDSKPEPWRDLKEEITKVVVQEGVTSIGHSAFYQCKKLDTLILPESLISIGDYAFAFCDSLEEVNIPENVSVISKDAFGFCSSLTSVLLPEKLTEIGDESFEYSGLREIRLPQSLKKIGEGVFVRCELLTKIELPQNMSSISFNMFASCSALTEIDLPEGITSIDDGAFMRCTSLKEINVPESVTVIGDNAFFSCEVLERIELPQNLEKMGLAVFENCFELKEIELPQSLKEMGDYIFYKCNSLAEIYIPKRIKRIGRQAFDSCGEITVHIPPTVEFIDSEAFARTTPLIYATPDSYAYNLAIDGGCEVNEEYFFKVGDVVDEITDSDISVMLNGKVIPSYSIDGRTLILIRDLERYGFDISFNSAEKVAYATFNPDKALYDGKAVQLYNNDVLYTDIRVIVNDVEIEARNTNGYVAVEAERLGEYVPGINCVWQNKERRLMIEVL